MTAPSDAPVITTVKYVCGAYVTNTVHGARASCTGGGQQAAERLAEKLWPGREVGVAQVPIDGADRTSCTSRWRLYPLAAGD